MSLPLEIVYGSLMLFLCALVHMLVLVSGIAALRHAHLKGPIKILGTGIFTTIAAHTLQIWGWAAALVFAGAFEDFGTSFYFAIATYTTVGYGDVVLDGDMRVFAAFAAVTGMLAFGISTAFLVSPISRPVPRLWREER